MDTTETAHADRRAGHAHEIDLSRVTSTTPD